MRTRGLIIILSIALGLSFWSPSLLAQTTNDFESGNSSTRRHMATIMFSGLAGTILGISTLSFYGRPQDHLTNVAVGLAVGIMVGAAYTTFKAATRPYEFYGTGGEMGFYELESHRRHLAQSDLQERAPMIHYGWSF